MAPPSTAAAHRVGTNLVLSSILALLSYVPFEWVAKATLLLCMALFILDPLPPRSRLLSLWATLVVAALSNLHRRHSHRLLLLAAEDRDDNTVDDNVVVEENDAGARASSWSSSSSWSDPHSQPSTTADGPKKKIA